MSMICCKNLCLVSGAFGKNRNEMVVKGVHLLPLEILELWKRNLAEFRDVGAQRVVGFNSPEGTLNSNPARRREQWQKPRFGTIKVNTDVAWCKETMRAGVGWVARDFTGLLQAAGGLGGLFCQSAIGAEACAIRDAFDYSIKLGFCTVIVESDAKALIQMIRKEITLDFNLDCMLGDIETLARSLESVTFNFVSRESNRAAHLVAKYVFQKGKNFIWDCIEPDFLFNILAQDVKFFIRL